MAYINLEELRTRFPAPASGRMIKGRLTESVDFAAGGYDVFLAHSFQDQEATWLLKRWLESFGYSVFVYWLEPGYNPAEPVTAGTADRLRTHIRNSRSLVVAFSRNSVASRWIPWELGFADAAIGKVALLPYRLTASEGNFTGQEYLALYPHIDGEALNMWVNPPGKQYMTIQTWLPRMGSLHG